AATTGPNNEPRPTSSTPATRRPPCCHTFFSKVSVQRSFLSKRNLAAAADSGLSDADLTFGNTERQQQVIREHLRPAWPGRATVENRLVSRHTPAVAWPEGNARVPLPA